jgi:hypothetical protein
MGAVYKSRQSAHKDAASEQRRNLGNGEASDKQELIFVKYHKTPENCNLFFAFFPPFPLNRSNALFINK